MKEELIDVIDENENVAKTVPKSVTREQNLLRRGGDFIVFNMRGQVLIHKRAAQKKSEPNLWDFLVGGWVLAGETPEQAAVRELKEEIGVVVKTPPVFVAKIRFRDDKNNNLTYIYRIMTEQSLTPQAEEVAELEWVTLDELRTIIERRNFTPQSQFLYENYCCELGLVITGKSNRKLRVNRQKENIEK